MYEKITLSVLLFLMGTGMVLAQNVKDEWVKVPYLQLPRHSFAENVKTYTSRILIPNGLAADQDRNSITASLQDAAGLPGYEKSADESGLITEVSLGWFGMADYPETLTEKRKEKRGDKEVEVEYYYYSMQYRYPMRLRVLQGDQVVEDTYVRNSNGYSYATTQKFANKTALYEYWKNSGSKFKSDLRDAELTANRNAIKTHLTNEYGYVKTQMKVEVNYVKEKKGANDYPKLAQAMEIVNSAAPKKIEGDVYPSEDFVAAVEDAMKLWKEELAESDLANRKARVDKKVTEAILKNMAVTCYLSYKFEEAEEYLKRLEEMKEGAWARAMRERIGDVQYRLAQYEKVSARK